MRNLGEDSLAPLFPRHRQSNAPPQLSHFKSAPRPAYFCLSIIFTPPALAPGLPCMRPPPATRALRGCVQRPASRRTGAAGSGSLSGLCSPGLEDHLGGEGMPCRRPVDVSQKASSNDSDGDHAPSTASVKFQQWRRRRPAIWNSELSSNQSALAVAGVTMGVTALTTPREKMLKLPPRKFKD